MNLLNETLAIAREAGKILLKHFRSDRLRVETKTDNSPVTEADHEASDYLVHALEKISGYPVVSEERVLSAEERRAHRRVWLVDPLDGTQDFVAGFEEYAVNIALVEDEKIIFGIIYGPSLDELFWAEKGKGAFVERGGSHIALPTVATPGKVGLVSRFHDSGAAKRFRTANHLTGELVVGAAIKFCRIAEGLGHVYAGGTGAGEWDTAPAQILLEEVGGSLLKISDGKPLRYNQENLRIPPYIALSPGLRLSDFVV